MKASSLFCRSFQIIIFFIFNRFLYVRRQDENNMLNSHLQDWRWILGSYVGAGYFVLAKGVSKSQDYTTFGSFWTSLFSPFLWAFHIWLFPLPNKSPKKKDSENKGDGRDDRRLVSLGLAAVSPLGWVGGVIFG